MLLCWSCQSPIAHSFSLLNHLNNFHGGIFKLNTKFGADSLFYSLILNGTGTQYTYSLNSVYRPHWLAQWSHHCSHMHIPGHSPWLPGYIDVTQTVLIILTMVGHFLDRPHVPIKLLQKSFLFICDLFPKCRKFQTSKNKWGNFGVENVWGGDRIISVPWHQTCKFSLGNYIRKGNLAWYQTVLLKIF